MISKATCAINTLCRINKRKRVEVSRQLSSILTMAFKILLLGMKHGLISSQFHPRMTMPRHTSQKSSLSTYYYGAPGRLFLACDPFLVSIGDDNGWSNWVKTNTLRVWEAKPGNQVDSFLIVLDGSAWMNSPLKLWRQLCPSGRESCKFFAVRSCTASSHDSMRTPKCPG